LCGVELGVFGPVVARAPSGLIEFSRAKERALLAALALFRGRAVSTDRLVDALWGDEPPIRAEKALQTHVQRLRGALGPGVVETRSDGYALATTVVVDADLFESEAGADGSAENLRAALARWTGEPYVDLGDWSPARLERERLAELRDHVLEACLALEIDAGAAGGCVGELETMVAEKPLRERRWLLLMTALQRDGRVAEALRTYQRARQTFVEELGIDPGPELRALEEQILMEGVESDGAVRASPAAVALPSGVVTFLLTDVEGSAESWEADASEMSRAVRLHDSLIGAAVSGAGGTLLKLHGEGEGTFSVFARATEAVNAAVTARRALDIQAWPEGLRLEARFAVHMGEVEERAGEYFGTAVNRAARIRSLAIGGQILVSHAVAEVVRDHLAADVSVVELGEQHLRGLAHPERVSAVVDAARPVREAIGGMCPYKGLLAFEPEDSDVFFGREETVGVLLGRLLARRLVVVVGASGSGKSSVVRAGVAAAIMRGEVAASKCWSSVILTPGEHPLRTLPEELRNADTTNRVVLVVDQMEELFTACRDATEREEFVDAVLDAVEQDDGSALVACALRADFYGHCAVIPRLATALSDASVLLGVMTDRELRRAIEGPAEVAGLRLETGLVDVMLADLAHEPGSLPLLSHALLETWRRRSGRTLTLHGYQESGGVRGAIAKTAEAVWTDALTERTRPVARRIFLRLTELGDGTEDTRRRVTRSELVSGTDAEATDEVLGLLVDRRLVTADDTTVQVAHEALIREWPRLRAWLDDDREGLRAHRHLTHAADDWTALGRVPSELYRGPRLAATREWLARDDTAQLNELEAAFMHESEALEQTERAARERATRRFHTLFAATAVLLIIAVAGALVATTQRNRAQHQATRADSQRLAAQAGNLAGSHLDLALLLAVEARELDDSVAARGALEAVLSQSARLERYVALGTHTASAVSADGRLLAVGHSDGAVEVRDLTNGRLVTTFADGTASVADLGFSADGQTLAVTHQDGTIDLRDLATGAARSLAGHAYGYWFGPTFSPDSRQLVAADLRGDLAIWDPTSSVRSATMLGRPRSDTVSALAWTPDGRNLAVNYASAETIAVWDVSTRRLARQMPVPNSMGSKLALGPDGHTLALGGIDGRIRLFDFATGRLSGPTLGDPGPSVDWLAFSPDGATLAVGNAAGTVTQWDVATRHPRGQPLVGVSADTYTGVLATGGRLITLGSHTAGVWRLTTVGPALGRLVADFPGSPAGVFLSHNGELAFMSANSADRWLLFDMARGHVVATHPMTDILYAGAWSPDTTKFAYGRPDGRVRLVDPRTGTNLGLLGGHRGVVFTVAFSPGGRTLAGGGADGTVIVWDVATHRPLSPPYTGVGAILGVAFSPDGKTLAITGLGGTVSVYDIATHRLRYTYNAHESLLRVAFGPDGKTLAVGTTAGETLLLDATTGRPRGEPLTGHGGEVYDVDFSGDGRTLATTSFDGTVILYNVASHQPIGEPLDAGYGGAVFGRLTPDGHTLASSYLQGQIVLWDIDPNTWQQRACETAGRNLTHDEWHQYLGARPYHKTCAQWPAGP
jgi:WD40 repeat protein/DNA-binding SARP family transcriptional activator